MSVCARPMRHVAWGIGRHTLPWCRMGPGERSSGIAVIWLEDNADTRGCFRSLASSISRKEGPKEVHVVLASTSLNIIPASDAENELAPQSRPHN